MVCVLEDLFIFRGGLTIPFRSQLITIPTGFAVTSFIGIVVSSSSNVIFGRAIWNPLDLLSEFLVGADSGERFGVFIIAAAFTLAQLGTNVAANSVSVSYASSPSISPIS